MTPEPTGTISEEAARLLAALQRWVGSRHPGEHPGEHLGEQMATGAIECRLCPVCRVIGVAKNAAHPEVVAHLAAASSEMLAALRAAITSRERSNEPSRERRNTGLQHIEVS